MSSPNTLIVLLFILVVAACAPSGPNPIIPGTYIAADSGERIVITRSSMYIHVKLGFKKPYQFRNREFTDYDVEPDGRIRFVVSSNEAFDYMKFSWYWRDGKIVKLNDDDNQTTLFIRLDE